MEKSSGYYSRGKDVYVRGGDSRSVQNSAQLVDMEVVDGNHNIHSAPSVGRCGMRTPASGSRANSSGGNGTVWPKGMVNVGNTCYANAALQCLLSTALANALLDPGAVRVFRRYSSNPNILEQGSGSVDSEDDDDDDEEDNIGGPTGDNAGAGSTKDNAGADAAAASVAVEDDESTICDNTTVSSWRPPSPPPHRKESPKSHPHLPASMQRGLPPPPLPPHPMIGNNKKLSKRQRKQLLKEQRRMHKTCQWLTRELRALTLEYTEPASGPSASSSYHIPNSSNRSNFGPKLVLDWLGGPTDPTASGEVINPGGITRHPDHLSKCLRPYRQEDAHEFLRALLSTLVMNGHNKQLSSLFDGLLESSVTCQTCRRPSLTRDRYMDLSLDIFSPRVVTLHDALCEFTKTETLSGENKVYCIKCKTKRTATKGLRLATAPSILVCHLKRFAFDDFGRLVRLHKCVEFPLQLEITDFMSRVNKARPPPYELVGVLVHQGRTCDSGHYLSFVKTDGQWFKCNDSQVTKVDVKCVLKQQAYILMYEVAEMRSRKNGLHSPAIQRHEARGAAVAAAARARARSSPQHRDGSPHQGGNILSYLCGVEVLDNSFLRDLCYDPSAHGTPISHTKSGKDQEPETILTSEKYFRRLQQRQDSDQISQNGVEIVAHASSYRDDLTVATNASSVGTGTDQSNASLSRRNHSSKNNHRRGHSVNERVGPAHRFRKSSSSGNLGVHDNCLSPMQTSMISRNSISTTHHDVAIRKKSFDYEPTARSFGSSSDPGAPTLMNVRNGSTDNIQRLPQPSGNSRRTPTPTRMITRRSDVPGLPPLPRSSPVAADQRRHSADIHIGGKIPLSPTKPRSSSTDYYSPAIAATTTAGTTIIHYTPSATEAQAQRSPKDIHNTQPTSPPNRASPASYQQ